MELKRVGEHTLLYAMAVEAEYGPHLKKRFTPLMTGVGPIEAGITIAATLAELRSKGRPPDLVVSLGSAGSAVLEQTAIYQISSVSYRDMDASLIGFEKGVTPFLDLPAKLDLPVQIPDLPSATLATGASIVSGAGYGAVDADMVDMESFAILRACQQCGVAMIGLRGISDGADELVHFNDWAQYLHVIDDKLATAVDLLETAIEQGEIL